MRTQLRRTALAASIAGLSLIAATPALAATFINVGDSTTINFNGNQPGTLASLQLTLAAGTNLSNNTYVFSYTLTNNSNTALNPTVRIPSFSFNDSFGTAPTNLSSVTGAFTNLSFGDNVPGQGTRDVCVSAQNCGGGNSGVLVGAPGTGTLTLDYTGSGTGITLDNFVVRYISTGLNSNGSGTGTGTEVPGQTGGPVPEPATWAMMLLGFGAIGASMRRRKAAGVRVRYGFA